LHANGFHIPNSFVHPSVVRKECIPHAILKPFSFSASKRWRNGGDDYTHALQALGIMHIYANSQW